MFSDTILDVINEIASPVEKQTFNMNVYDHAAPGNNSDPHLETKVELSNMPDEKYWLPAAMYEVADKSVANDLIAGAANKLGKNKGTTYEELLVDLCRTYLSDAQLEDIPYDIKPKEGDMWEKAKSSH
jgi:hypothetical protein